MELVLVDNGNRGPDPQNCNYGLYINQLYPPIWSHMKFIAFFIRSSDLSFQRLISSEIHIKSSVCYYSFQKSQKLSDYEISNLSRNVIFGWAFLVDQSESSVSWKGTLLGYPSEIQSSPMELWKLLEAVERTLSEFLCLWI